VQHRSSAGNGHTPYSANKKNMITTRKNIAIVGVGLMGGSLALQLHDKKISGKLVGVEQNPDHAAAALIRELVDEILPLQAAIEQCDIIALCLPVDILFNSLPNILNGVQQQVVFDMGSTKHSILEAVKYHPKRGRFVATHPMWGTENSGPEAAQKNAFENKAVVLCNGNESDADALNWVQGMYRKIGMHLIEMDAAAHDLHAAYISHISHVTSFALANTVLHKEREETAIFEMASSGFESTVRLAKSSPAMWAPIFRQNKNNVLDVLDEHIVRLQEFRNLLEQDNEPGLRQYMEQANTIKKILK
jgi:prephenate dehydrogenase